MTDNQDNMRYTAILDGTAASPVMAQSSSSDDEVDLREIWLAIWRGKWLIVSISILFAIGSVYYALSLPNMYKSDVILAPANSGN